ncbi:hypothetical protein C8A05DRAFT_20405 [Staphylotrichum tortipilum]|uniref:RBP protein n=1 Tax=Staphylotrichum tortipilum TaxID=2831512 RepID=A0AAN6M9A5_9PEZI|nr:hypothetical protein C8A05DRAFT_20405 [Staphylotrichum longicolle]
MDEPAPSKVVKVSNGKIGYSWILTDTERAHISDMLGIDASQLELQGYTMAQERSICRGCGKHSGLDDLVHNALFAGNHSAAFIVDVLINGPKGPSAPHDVVCSRCTTRYEDPFIWEILYELDP